MLPELMNAPPEMDITPESAKIGALVLDEQLPALFQREKESPRDEQVRRDIGTAFHTLRTAVLRISLMQAYEWTGVSPSAMSRLERGERASHRIRGDVYRAYASVIRERTDSKAA